LNNVISCHVCDLSNHMCIYWVNRMLNCQIVWCKINFNNDITWFQVQSNVLLDEQNCSCKLQLGINTLDNFFFSLFLLCSDYCNFKRTNKKTYIPWKMSVRLYQNLLIEIFCPQTELRSLETAANWFNQWHWLLKLWYLPLLEKSHSFMRTLPSSTVQCIFYFLNDLL